MTVKQKQNLLQYLGYYTGTPDGDWGPLSRQALEAFQRDFCQTTDGIWGEETEKRILEVIYNGEEPPKAEESPGGTFWDEIEHFDRSEFKCTCGGRGCNGFPVEPKERLVRNLEATRKHFGKAVVISSGVRCQLRNSELPGSAANSLHMEGGAGDFAVTGVHSSVTLAYIKTLPDVDEAYAIDGSYVHMGVQKY